MSAERTSWLKYKVKYKDVHLSIIDNSLLLRTFNFNKLLFYFIYFVVLGIGTTKYNMHARTHIQQREDHGTTLQQIVPGVFHLACNLSIPMLVGRLQYQLLSKGKMPK